MSEISKIPPLDQLPSELPTPLTPEKSPKAKSPKKPQRSGIPNQNPEDIVDISGEQKPKLPPTYERPK